MNLFDSLVNEALLHQPQLSSLRHVVEKELLHHDIFRVLSEHQLLEQLVFIGGTCLRCCYGGIQLSEDLDFTGGRDFKRTSLSHMGKILQKSLQNKYGLQVHITEPVKDKKNVDTWKIKIETRPQKRHLPAQRINIDICSVPSYEKRATLISNPYRVDIGTSGIVLQAESQEEIYADKLLAFALRPNRLKNRDLWDIIWLHQKGIQPQLGLLPQKVADRGLPWKDFANRFQERIHALKSDPHLSVEFSKEMGRFLSADVLEKTIKQSYFWDALIHLIEGFAERF